MGIRRKLLPVPLLLFACLGGACSWSKLNEQPAATANHVALDLNTSSEFAFVAFGDGGEQRRDADIALTLQSVQSHAAVLPAAPAEQDGFRGRHQFLPENV